MQSFYYSEEHGGGVLGFSLVLLEVSVAGSITVLRCSGGIVILYGSVKWLKVFQVKIPAPH